jgi:hypothetical protein
MENTYTVGQLAVHGKVTSDSDEAIAGMSCIVDTADKRDHYQGKVIGFASTKEAAALWAAAPDLLEALREAVEQLERNFIEVPQDWRAAISRAEGHNA